jgi:hypothetical protein
MLFLLDLFTSFRQAWEKIMSYNMYVYVLLSVFSIATGELQAVLNRAELAARAKAQADEAARQAAARGVLSTPQVAAVLSSPSIQHLTTQQSTRVEEARTAEATRAAEKARQEEAARAEEARAAATAEAERLRLAREEAARVEAARVAEATRAAEKARQEEAARVEAARAAAAAASISATIKTSPKDHRRSKPRAQ